MNKIQGEESRGPGPNLQQSLTMRLLRKASSQPDHLSLTVPFCTKEWNLTKHGGQWARSSSGQRRQERDCTTAFSFSKPVLHKRPMLSIQTHTPPFRDNAPQGNLGPTDSCVNSENLRGRKLQTDLKKTTSHSTRFSLRHSPIPTSGPVFILF